jgi:hypothetical protein
MIRPIIEYAGVVFDGCADTHGNRLENIQRQAALACTSAYKHTKHEDLLQELGWPPLTDRRTHQRLNLMFKIQKGTAPQYLKETCPPLTKERTNYNLRTGMNITTPLPKTVTYQKSFFPQSISDWNNLPQQIREATSISAFKENLKKTIRYKTNPNFHHNSSKAAINHTRIRLGLSGLSSQRFHYNHINDPRCQTCGARNEDPMHYFLICPTYAAPCPVFLESICEILNDNDLEIDFRRRQFRDLFLQIILRGIPKLNEQTTAQIFTITQTYITNTKRFL